MSSARLRVCALACTLLLLAVGLAGAAAAQPLDTSGVCPPDEPLGDIDFAGEGGVHAASIECLAQYGVVSGKADGTFGSAESLRRDQMATIVAGFIEVARGEPLAPGTVSFDDVAATNTHVGAIQSLASAGIVRGVGDGDYDPAGSVSRAHLATFVAATLDLLDDGQVNGSFPPSADGIFDDVAGSVHADNIQALGALGVVLGTAERRYEPAQPVRRGQAATMFIRAAAAALELDAWAPGSAAPVGDDVIFRDDFERSDVGDDWALTGDWSIVGDALVASGSGIAMWDEELSAEVRADGYYLEARVRKDGANGVGLVAGRDERDAGRHLFPHMYQESEARLGTMGPPDGYDALGAEPFPNAYGDWFVVRIEVRGSDAVMYVDDDEQLSAFNIRDAAGGWVGLRAIQGGTGATSFDYDYVEAGRLEPLPPPGPLSPGSLLASESFDEDGQSWPDQWDLDIYNWGTATVQDQRGTLTADASGVVDLYALNTEVAVDDGYQSLTVHYDGQTRGGAALVFRHAPPSVDGAQPDSYRLFWLPEDTTGGGLWIRHSKDGVKTTLAQSDVWDDQEAGAYILEGGIDGNDIKVRLRPEGSEPRAADDWDLEFTHTGSGFLESGGVGIFSYTQGGTGSTWQVDDWELYDLADQ